ncbi:hypothetical protein [Kineothrix sedimenti]|uniref:Uncharacterized protein n=1 Tax=Kineothrix sedimenti TaxID=3123317 RepID=A0ABZ3ERC2_9FIRM
MSYDTWMVQSVVIVPKLRDYKTGKSVKEMKKEKKETAGKKDFEAILRQMMK